MGNTLQSSRTFKPAKNGFAAVASSDDLATTESGIQLALAGSAIMANKPTEASTLLDLYMKRGKDFLDDIQGEFALAITDREQEKVILATDRIGRFPIFYSGEYEHFVFGTNANAVLAGKQEHGDIDPQGIYNYLFNHMVPSPSSIYQQLNKLPAAHFLEIDSSRVVIKPYWVPGFSSNSKTRHPQLSSTLKDTLREAVITAAGVPKKTGSFLSGGLDSSTVSGMLAEITEGESPAFSIGFDAQGYDEIEYARLSAKHFGIKLHEYYVTPEDVVEALPTIATSYDEPFGNSSALPAWFCAKFAKEHGIERLLAGDGGDELFAGNERYAKQKLFQIYYNLPPTLREKCLTPAAKHLPNTPSLLRKVKSYIEQATVPLPDRLQSYNFLNRHPADEMFTCEFIEQVNQEEPIEFMRSTYGRPENADDVSRMLYMDWQYTLADNDLRKVTHMCSIAGVDVRYPMLDDRLVEFSCEIPSQLKLKGQELRYFYKQALRGWLPNATIDKPKQGFGLPFGVWLKEHPPLREMGYDCLNSFRQRNIIRGEFLDQLIKLHQEVHPHYYGEFIWVILVLELWLEQRGAF